MADDERIRLYRVGPTPEEAKKTFTNNKMDISPWLRDHIETSGLLYASGRWFTSDRSEAEWYTREHPTHKLRHVDVPAALAATWIASEHPVAKKFSSRENDHFIPAVVANQAQPERALSPDVQPPTRGISR